MCGLYIALQGWVQPPCGPHREVVTHPEKGLPEGHSCESKGILPELFSLGLCL